MPPATGDARAEALQRRLLPDRLPDVPGIELAGTYLPVPGDVGGDWYDVMPLADGSVVVAIGDVVGRGASAVAVVGKLRSAVHTYALEGQGPGQVLSSVNELMTDVGREMSTLVLLMLDPRTGELRGANAGHPPVLIGRRGGSVERWNACRSVPLGVLPDTVYEEATEHLQPGDVLLLFTDGLVERRSQPLADALRRLESALRGGGSADEVRTGVLEALLGDQDHDDDVAVLAVKVSAPG